MFNFCSNAARNLKSNLEPMLVQRRIFVSKILWTRSTKQEIGNIQVHYKYHKL